MFGNTKKSNAKPTAAPMSTPGNSSGINTLVNGTHIEGNITAQNDIRIDGSVEGVLNCSGKLIIGPDGRVDGEATCLNAVIEGRFEGTLSVTEVLDVRESANVSGDIKTGKLLVQTGAVFNGSCDMGKKVKTMAQETGNPSTINEASAS